MTVVEGLLFAAVQLMLWSPLAVVGVPPVVMGVRRRWSLLGAALWLAGVALAVAWVAAWLADMDRADATGESGDILGGIGWLLAALGAATASVVLAARPPARRPDVAGGRRGRAGRCPPPSSAPAHTCKQGRSTAGE